MRNDFDAILVGIETVLKDNPRLNATRKPLKKIVLDSKLRVSPRARLFRGVKPSDCFLVTTKQAPLRKIESLRRLGLQVLISPQRSGKVDLKWLMKELAKHQIASILIEGGARVIGQALKLNIVDKMYIYIAPKIMGDEKALSSICGLNISRLDQSIPLRDISVERIAEDILIQGYL